jgi:hypothetical protein
VGAGASRGGPGIILARFFDSFFIDWKNGYTAIRFADGSFLITPLASFHQRVDQSFNGEDKARCNQKRKNSEWNYMILLSEMSACVGKKMNKARCKEQKTSLS